MDFVTITKEKVRLKAPEFVALTARWLSLLEVNFTTSYDEKSHHWMFLLEKINLPDIYLEYNSTGRVMTIFTNGLTLISSANPNSIDFIIEVLKEQFPFTNARLCIVPGKDSPIKLMNQFKSANVTLEFFIETIKEYEEYLKIIKELISRYKLPEKWREYEKDYSD